MSKLRVTDSSGNVFRDLGLPCPDEKLEIVRLRVLLERHRTRFRSECSEIGYDETETEELLEELETVPRDAAK